MLNSKVSYLILAISILQQKSEKVQNIWIDYGEKSEKVQNIWIDDGAILLLKK